MCVQEPITAAFLIQPFPRPDFSPTAAASHFSPRAPRSLKQQSRKHASSCAGLSPRATCWKLSFLISINDPSRQPPPFPPPPLVLTHRHPI
ncbi:uncharacterized protein K489DRAFT_381969 [Dissoconium aciculare CBS 342.82]|uniref:Uncharacterized protein n=1 Tax=Dissoconium aciculare CBS 342.82 TaxID=1314786 RepID=A0A6J3M1X1_9PEZI|nr:uncharacterized protein K489DRAFT_381969 [Dissoconium aciculare CBS 342.82]KAF1820922.1 hypothetical protein K489DRAFT_381969 [Dissoconium aciculare CBS 342.82]